jgi:hypothetical protein
MKRYITVMVCAVIALFYTDVVTAQVSANANVTVSVQSTLLVTNLSGDLAFGNRMPDDTYEIQAVNGVNFRVSGASNVPVFVSYTAPGQLSGPGESIDFTAEVIGGQSSDPAAAASVASGPSVTTDASGNYYLWLGGTIDVGNILPGSYTGLFTVTVDYNL